MCVLRHVSSSTMQIYQRCRQPTLRQLPIPLLQPGAPRCILCCQTSRDTHISSDVALASLPKNCLTVIWVDFEASATAQEGPLKPELKKVVENLFNQEAANFITFDGKLMPAKDGQPPLFRLALYFAVDFWKTITGPNAYVGSLQCFKTDVELTGSLTDLINESTTRPVLVRGGNVNIEIDREATPCAAV